MGTEDHGLSSANELSGRGSCRGKADVDPAASVGDKSRDGGSDDDESVLEGNTPNPNLHPLQAATAEDHEGDSGREWKRTVVRFKKTKDDGGGDSKRDVGNLEEDPLFELRDGEGGAGVCAWDHADELSGYEKGGSVDQNQCHHDVDEKEGTKFGMDVRTMVYALEMRPITRTTREQQSLQLQVFE
ncbi:hypothetical protein GALMADRAFT_145140 [Galerina marginata CBS 339.88]|uniref:Uncharacterized protein n=1 Tax=Galerina marginata (strain CBS 339.88) TaxID=685588 RepID=A0A067SFP6_GALM3|nr:hypothetical protein GALMADRAFT_145140 [Galerina marginata CBS 339.88]